MPTPKKHFSNEEVAAYLDSVREDVVVAGRWVAGDWVEKLLYDEAKPYDDPVELPSCKWKFCLGGALAWMALPHKSYKGKTVAFNRIVDYSTFINETPLAAAGAKAVADVIRRTKWAKDRELNTANVDVIVHFNDALDRTRGDIIRVLRRAASDLRRTA